MSISDWWRRVWPAQSRPRVPESAGSKPGATAPGHDARWIVVDVEASGLDARHDRLLAIAAFAVHFDAEDVSGTGRLKPHIALSDSFEVVLRQDGNDTLTVDRQNILIHGIGVGTQRSGIDPFEALNAWHQYASNCPLVAYHSDFDQTMIERTSRQHLGRTISNAWLDLEPLAAVLHQDPRRHPLDRWLDRYQIGCLTRHQAAADALATAQLLLRLWPMLPERVRHSGFSGVLDYAAGHRFIAGRH
jgi:DNA polymerase-3 subunit epsilon